MKRLSKDFSFKRPKHIFSFNHSEQEIIQKVHNLYRYALFSEFNLSPIYSKTCLKRPLKKKTKIDFQDRFRLSLNACQKYCRMFQGEHSAILSTFIKLPFVINIFVLSIFELPLKTDFTVLQTMGF